MELDEFVQKTIEQVIKGVGGACPLADAHGCQIGGGSMTSIEFDIALTTTAGSEKKAGAGITVAGIGIGGHGKTELTNSSMSRIKFSLFVSLPTTQKYR